MAQYGMKYIQYFANICFLPLKNYSFKVVEVVLLQKRVFPSKGELS